MNLSEVNVGEVLRVNDDLYQVVEHTSSWYDTNKGKLEMVLALVRLGEKFLKPKFFLFYFREEPEKPLRFEEFDVKTGKYNDLNLELIVVKRRDDG